MSVIKTASVFVGGALVGAAAIWFFPSALSHQQPYAAQHDRAISSLSAKDIAQLEQGQGWGLAKPAEFNGYPGPAHVIEFADQLSLKAEQRQAVEASFARMQAAAKRLGVALIEAESALDDAFKSKAIDDITLAALLERAEQVRADLRAVHLQAHLEVTPILNEEQKTLYASLRGYGSGGHSGHDGH